MNTQKRWHYFDETARRRWQTPEAVLDAIGLKPGFTFVDVGCGNGFFSIPAARLVGNKGRVYGVDIGHEAIDELRKKAESEGLTNIETKVSKAEDAVLCLACADIVFFGIVLHDFQDPVKVLKNARKMLKPEGKLANLDWKKIAMAFGPPLNIRFDEAAATRLIEAAGFKVETISESGEYNYLIVAKPI
jgi:ubiquinone/menaquinone biosynthesis C-methylase UbiE